MSMFLELSILSNIKSSNNVTYNDPTITLVRGKTYEFDVSSPGHPFWIKTTQSTGSSNVLESGITNNGTTNGKITDPYS